MNTQQFLSEFRHIVSAPNGVNQLRKLIYNLAITGKLTTQLDGDDDTDLLLLNIKSVIRQLTAAKTFKSSPQLEHSPFLVPENIRIPNSWRWTRLADIGEINPRNSDVADDCLASFIPMSGLPELHSDKLKFEEHLWGRMKKGYTHFADGDVVIAKITPCFENGKAAVISGLTNGIGAGTTELHVVRLLPNLIEPNYVYAFLRSPYFISDGKGKMTGTAGQKRLPLSYFATRAFPLPPIAEQHRIVAKVDELMKLCDKLESQQQERIELCKLTRTAALDALRNAQSPAALRSAWERLDNALSILFNEPTSVLELATTIKDLALQGVLTERGPGNAEDLLAAARQEQLRLLEQNRVPKIKGLLSVTEVPYDLPENWRWSRLHQVAEVIDPNPSHRMPNYIPYGVPFISTESLMDNDQIDFSVSKQVSAEVLAEHIRRYEILDGSFAFSRIGTIGKTCHLPKQRTYCISHVLVVISSLTQEIDEQYLRLAVSAETTIKQAREGVKSIGVPDLGMSKIRNFLLPIPPKEEQIRIVEKVARLLSICNTLEASISTAQPLANEFALSAISSIIGIQIEDNEKMKIPKTELISTLRIGVSPANSERAPLAAILIRNNGEIPAKTLWQASGLEIDAFYQQLKAEMARGWIVQPEIASMREVEAS